MTHRSCGSTNYERLEFLGDSVLGLIISEELYHRHPGLNEGTLSRMRANLVRGKTLAELARERELGEWLHLGESELKSGVFNRDSILADVVESIIGALFLDQGMAATREFVLSVFGDRLDQVATDSESLKDPKTRLQEILQSFGLPLPDYALLESTGKPHEKVFTVECRVELLKVSASATASSRRKAEQASAAEVLGSADLEHDKMLLAVRRLRKDGQIS